MCLECKKHFVSKQNLKEHHFIHTGEKPFPCDEPGCFKRFRQISQLSIHKRIHDRKKFNYKDDQSTQVLMLNLMLELDPKIKSSDEIKNDDVSLPMIYGNRCLEEIKLPVLPYLLSIKLDI
jgi:uncharacterized Zn-finger protein